MFRVCSHHPLWPIPRNNHGNAADYIDIDDGQIGQNCEHAVLRTERVK